MSKLLEKYGAAPKGEAPIVVEEEVITAEETQAEEIIEHDTNDNSKEYRKFGLVELEVRKELNPSDLKYVPESAEYIDNKRMLETIAHGIRENLPVLLVGETGVGKTSAIRYIASQCNVPLRRLNLNGATTVDEFVGKTMLDKEGTYWIDGVLIDAMRRGHWLVLDELNAALPEILFVLQSLLDDDRYVVLAESDGEVVRPHANFRVFATMNPSDNYAGTKDLNKALLSRFAMVLTVDWPTEAEEKKIVEKRYPKRTVITADKLASMVKFANEMRNAYGRGAQEFLLSPRDLLNWVHMSEILGDITKGAEVTLVNKARGEEREAIRDLLKLRFGMAIFDYVPECQKGRVFETGDKVVITKSPEGEGDIPEERTNVYMVEVIKIQSRDGGPTKNPEDYRYDLKVLATNVRGKDGDRNFGNKKTLENVPLHKLACTKYHGDNF